MEKKAFDPIKIVLDNELIGSKPSTFIFLIPALGGVLAYIFLGDPFG